MTTDNPTVSIIFPVKNEGDNVRNTLDVFCNSKMQSLAANLCRTLPTSIQKNLGRLHAG
jgi:hypothetical protein